MARGFLDATLLGQERPLRFLIMSVDEYWYLGPIDHYSLGARCGDLLRANRDKEVESIITPNGDSETAYRVADRSHFIRLMRESMVELGLVAEEGEFNAIDEEDIDDFRSWACLSQIFDVNRRSWIGKIHYEQGMKSQAILCRFPAWRFRRISMGDDIPSRFEGLERTVVLKTEKNFWSLLGDDPLLDLRRPWDPDGFSKYFHLEDVDREEARELGLKVDDAKPAKRKLNDKLAALVKKMDPEVKKKLIAELRARKESRKGRETAQEAGRQAALRVRERQKELQGSLLRLKVENRIAMRKRIKERQAGGDLNSLNDQDS